MARQKFFGLDQITNKLIIVLGAGAVDLLWFIFDEP